MREREGHKKNVQRKKKNIPKQNNRHTHTHTKTHKDIVVVVVTEIQEEEEEEEEEEEHADVYAPVRRGYCRFY